MRSLPPFAAAYVRRFTCRSRSPLASGPPGRTDVSISIRAAAGPPAPLTRSVSAALASGRPRSGVFIPAAAGVRRRFSVAGTYPGRTRGAVWRPGAPPDGTGALRRDVRMRSTAGSSKSGSGWRWAPGMRTCSASSSSGASPSPALVSILGLAAAVATTRYLEALLFGVVPLDPLTFRRCGWSCCAGVATTAALIPALRATRIDPLMALRSE